MPLLLFFIEIIQHKIVKPKKIKKKCFERSIMLDLSFLNSPSNLAG